MRLLQVGPLLLLLATFANSFVYQVKSPKISGTLCFTNETDSAVAVVRRLPWGIFKLKQSSPIIYLPILETEKLAGASCHMHSNCTNWEKSDYVQEWSITSERANSPVFDRRWNYLPETLTDGSQSIVELLSLTKNDRGVFHLSVLARHSAMVIFSQDNFRSGFVIAVDGFLKDVIQEGSLAKSKSKIRFSMDLISYTFPTLCTVLDEKNHTERILTDGSAWHLISIGYDLAKSSFGLNLSFNNMNILSTTSNSNKEWKENLINDSNWRVGVRSYESPAIFKLHSYFTLRSLTQDRKMKIETNFTVQLQPHRICLDLIYFCAQRARTEIFLVTITKKEKKGKKIRIVSGLTKAWERIRVMTDKYLPGEYTIEISALSNFVYLGDISVCSNGIEMVVSNDYDATSCTLLGNFPTSSVNIPDNDNKQDMDSQLALALAMSALAIAHVVSFLSVVVVWLAWQRNKRVNQDRRC